MPRLPLAILAATALLAAACSRPPQVPKKDDPVDPQAARNDGLRRAIDAPLQRARDVQATVDAAKKAQDAAVDAAEAAP